MALAQLSSASSIGYILDLSGFAAFWVGWIVACALVHRMRHVLLRRVPRSDLEWGYGCCACVTICCTASRLLERLGVRGRSYRLCALLPVDSGDEAARGAPAAEARAEEGRAPSRRVGGRAVAPLHEIRMHGRESGGLVQPDQLDHVAAIEAARSEGEHGGDRRDRAHAPAPASLIEAMRGAGGVQV